MRKKRDSNVGDDGLELLKDNVGAEVHVGGYPHPPPRRGEG